MISIRRFSVSVLTVMLAASVSHAQADTGRDEAGETEQVPDDWRDRAWRYRDAMAAAVEAMDEVRFYLETVVRPANADEAQEASRAERFNRRSNRMGELLNDTTSDGEALAWWQKYERNAYGGDTREIDW